MADKAPVLTPASEAPMKKHAFVSTALLLGLVTPVAAQQWNHDLSSPVGPERWGR